MPSSLRSASSLKFVWIFWANWPCLGFQFSVFLGWIFNGWISKCLAKSIHECWFFFFLLPGSWMNKCLILNLFSSTNKMDCWLLICLIYFSDLKISSLLWFVLFLFLFFVFCFFFHSILWVWFNIFWKKSAV